MSTDKPDAPRDDAADLSTRLTAAVKRWAYAAVSAREMSSAMLTRRLADKATRRFPDAEPAARDTAVATAVAACIGYGFIDDARFAEMSVRGGVARGHSRRRIALTLKEKGVAAAESLQAVDDLAGALRLLRRRRLGPWAVAAATEETDADEIAPPDDVDETSTASGFGRRRLETRRLAARPQDRAMGLLVRNGFSLEVARRALSMTLDEAEAHLDGRASGDD